MQNHLPQLAVSNLYGLRLEAGRAMDVNEQKKLAYLQAELTEMKSLIEASEERIRILLLKGS